MTIEQKIADLEKTVKTFKAHRMTCEDIELEIAWLTDYRNRLRKEVEFRPATLYAIEHIPTGKIIFNARGGCYKHWDEAEAKLSKIDGDCRIVTYKLQRGGVIKLDNCS